MSDNQIDVYHSNSYYKSFLDDYNDFKYYI